MCYYVAVTAIQSIGAGIAHVGCTAGVAGRVRTAMHARTQSEHTPAQSLRNPPQNKTTQHKNKLLTYSYSFSVSLKFSFCCNAGYGASGTADAEVVYVNRGMPEDFETLAGLNVSVRGKVVLVR